ncbi:MAG: hypothetical protein ACT4OZ_07505 [Gemmatimonadota bacterium]
MRPRPSLESKAARPRWLGSRHFRTNPDSAAVILSRLAEERLRGVASRSSHADTIAGVARVLRSLRRSGPLPGFFRKDMDESGNSALARLVLDDVLQIRDRGRFLGGPAAHAAIIERSVRVPRHASARSVRILNDFSLSRIASADEMTRFLYFADRRPVTPSLRQLCRDPQTTLDYLMTGLGDAEIRRLSATFRRHELPTSADDWIFWSSPENRPVAGSDGVSFKLYVSPKLDNIREVFQRTMPALGARSVAHFKIGSGAYALARADCMVVYFRSKPELDLAARGLQSSLDGLEGHGVPFTSAIGTGDLLSWGADFDEALHRRRRPEQTSWRMWLCRRLARFLVLGMTDPRVSAVTFALDRLSLDGVGPDFSPTPAFLAEAAHRS